MSGAVQTEVFGGGYSLVSRARRARQHRKQEIV